LTQGSSNGKSHFENEIEFQFQNQIEFSAALLLRSMPESQNDKILTEPETRRFRAQIAFI
jgi:hypothetical protein